MNKISLSLAVIFSLLICLSSCSYHPDFPVGSNSDYEEIHNWGPENPLYKGKGYYDVGYCPDGVYKDYNTSCYFKIMEDGKLYFDKSTFKSGLITVSRKAEDEKSYYQLYTGSYGDSPEPVKQGDVIRVDIKMEPYFTTKKNQKFYEFSIYLDD